MLINTISFDIHDFTNHSDETFLVENTINNQEWIFTSRKTRNVQFDQIFDFQFEKEMREPQGMALAVAWYELMDSVNDSPDEIDSVDEMVGTF